MTAARQRSRAWYRLIALLGCVCLVYLYTGELQEHVLDQLPILSYHNAKKSLQPMVFVPLPLGSIKPLGWLRDQMQLMSDGLPGHLHDFYKFVSRSKWLGRDQEYSGLNEGFPYWLNGLVPLAYGLDDDRLKAQVHSAVRIVLDNQTEDGWLGPEDLSDRLIWARFPLCLGLMQLAQANETWTGPIVISLHRFSLLLNQMLINNGSGYLNQPAGDWSSHMMSWGRVRGHDMIIALQWLLEYHPNGNSRALITNMQMLHKYSLKWEDWYNEAAYFGQGIHEDLLGTDNEITEANFHYMHGVNIAQGLKAAAVIRRFTRNESLVQTAVEGFNWTMTYHGAASGTIIADERLVGLAAYSGSELCTSVELLASLSYLYQALGLSTFADGAELAAFNSLPVMVMPDWWAHQYVTAPNQPHAAYLAHQPFYNTNNWAQTYGLEPHYPCCTVNHPQGFPKYLSSMFARVGDNGIAHTLLGPASVQTSLASGRVTIQANTAYPFADDIEYTIKNEGPFELSVRIPHWAGAQSFIIVGEQGPAPMQPMAHSRQHVIPLKSGQTRVSVHLQSSIRMHMRPKDTFAVYKGSLLYALHLNSSAASSLPRQYRQPEEFYDDKYAPSQVADHVLHTTSAWNVAVDPATLTWHDPAFDDPADLSNPVFDSGTNVGFIAAMACEIAWSLLAHDVPDHPPPVGDRECLGDAFQVKLVPYGSAKLHMADLPSIDLTKQRVHPSSH